MQVGDRRKLPVKLLWMPGGINAILLCKTVGGDGSAMTVTSAVMRRSFAPQKSDVELKNRQFALSSDGVMICLENYEEPGCPVSVANKHDILRLSSSERLKHLNHQATFAGTAIGDMRVLFVGKAEKVSQLDRSTELYAAYEFFFERQS